MSLFDAGVKIIEDEFKIPVLGVVPYKPFNLGFEDSASLMNYSQNTTNAIITVGVIKLPYISNFTDFEPLIIDEQINVRFITNVSESESCDLLIIPGSKRVIDDLAWLRERGFEESLSSKKTKVVAICGGYEMMFEQILDPEHIESTESITQGFGRFKGEVLFQKEKIVKRGCYNLFGTMCSGYEIHNGTTKKRAKEKKNIYGTFVHGLFDNDLLRYGIFNATNPEYKGYNFKEYKAKAIAEFATHIETHIDMKIVENALYE
jgi:adenosylcobyric acid synthase